MKFAVSAILFLTFASISDAHNLRVAQKEEHVATRTANYVPPAPRSKSHIPPRSGTHERPPLPRSGTHERPPLPRSGTHHDVPPRVGHKQDKVKSIYWCQNDRRGTNLTGRTPGMPAILK